MIDPLFKDFLQVSLPQYNRDIYHIKKLKISPNPDDETNKVYLEKIDIWIEEKDVFPAILWEKDDWYSHWFGGKKSYSDQAMRWRLVVIHERNRRRRHKKTHQIGTSQQPSVLLEWTKAPTDVLNFLKIGS